MLLYAYELIGKPAFSRSEEYAKQLFQGDGAACGPFNLPLALQFTAYPSLVSLLGLLPLNLSSPQYWTSFSSAL